MTSPHAHPVAGRASHATTFTPGAARTGQGRRTVCALAAAALTVLAVPTLLVPVRAADAPKAPGAASSTLPFAVARRAQAATGGVYEGTVEAVRQTQVSAQVAGAVVDLNVKAGDRVRTGQILARVDSRAADQGASASQAQVAAARAQVELAQSNVERQRQLHAESFISKSALDQAESQHRAAVAQWRAAAAQGQVAQTQTAFHVIRAPYDGVVSAVPVALGDMALPGRALLTMYDPKTLRVTAGVPSSDLQGTSLAAAAVSLRIPALGDDVIQPTRVELLPTVDATTLTQVVRADLPADAAAKLAPGQFARMQLNPAAPDPKTTADAAVTLAVPAGAIVRRSELTAVYVLDAQGKPLLRQVRLGQPLGGGDVEVLAGLDAGERVVTQPAKAVRP